MKEAWCNGHDPDTELGKLTRGGQTHGGNPTFGRRISGLAKLPILPRDRGSIDDHATLTVVERIHLRHAFGGMAHHIVRAIQVYFQCFIEHAKRQLAFPADDTGSHANSSTIDRNAGKGGQLAFDFVKGRSDCGFVADVGLYRNCVDF